MKHIIIMKGASAYELQIGCTVFRYVHLMGGKWKWWNFWNRISVKRFSTRYNREPCIKNNNT